MDRIKYIAWLLIACLATVSCMKDIQLPTPNGPQEAGKARVRFEIKTPSTSLPGTRTIDENTIEDIKIIVLKTDAENGFVYDYEVDVTSYENVDGKTTFTANLNVSDEPVKLMLMINKPDITPVLDGLNEEAVRDALVCGYAHIFPIMMDMSTTMTGEVLLPKIDLTENAPIDVLLLRTMARVDVQLNLGDDSRPFEITKIKVYQMVSGSPIFPDPVAYDDPDSPSKVTAPSLIYNSIEVIQEFETFIPSVVSGLVGTAYVFENKGGITVEEQLASTCMVIEGKYNNSENITYYRIDFNSGKDGHPFGQVLRNHRYMFNITKVTAPGFPSLIEALQNISRTMVMEVQAWEENGSEVYILPDGGYLGLFDKSVTVPYNTGGIAAFTMRSNLLFQWQLDPGTTPIDNTTPGPISNDFYTVTMTSELSGGYTDYTFTVEARSDNVGDTADERPSQVLITVDTDDGPMVFSVDITQATLMTVSRKINVLSLGTSYGTMGVYYEGGTSSYPTELRTMLTNHNYFGPDEPAPVRFDGFTFDVMTYSLSDLNTDELRRALVATDILVADCTAGPDAEAVDIILEWLEDPGHVLIVSADYDYSNAVLLDRLATDGNGLTWHPISDIDDPSLLGSVVDALGNLLDLILNLASVTIDAGGMMAAPTVANTPFIDGVFGLANQTQVAGTGVYTLWDGLAQWAAIGEGSPVIPLMVFQITQEINYLNPLQQDETKVEKIDEMMLVGVDPDRRIIYMGESQLIDTYFDSNPGTTAGESDTPYYSSITTLLCNTWAWAVNTVLSAN